MVPNMPPSMSSASDTLSSSEPWCIEQHASATEIACCWWSSNTSAARELALPPASPPRFAAGACFPAGPRLLSGPGGTAGRTRFGAALPAGGACHNSAATSIHSCGSTFTFASATRAFRPFAASFLPAAAAPPTAETTEGSEGLRVSPGRWAAFGGWDPALGDEVGATGLPGAAGGEAAPTSLEPFAASAASGRAAGAPLRPRLSAVFWDAATDMRLVASSARRRR
mmetsp:Transcript_10493/g.23426  ORF Transcript_10493/g.23426 Transcript_10493/m.23426 type:complete len:226 (+) Transcript_10493:167-844(+)